MALHGHAFLALWNDIARNREPEYDRWHTQEHVPQRVAVTGFHGARRYVNRGREQHRYFTLYDVANIDVFDSREYADLVDQPTPWSASMRPDFSNFLRVIGRVTHSEGDGIGAALAVLCYEHEHVRDAAALQLQSVRALPGVIACHLGEGFAGSSTRGWSGPPPAPASGRAFDRIFMIETLDRDAAARALAHVSEPLGLGGQPPDFGCDVYDLAFVFPGHDASERRRHRRPHWDALAS